MNENQVQSNWKDWLIPITLCILLADLGLMIAIFTKLGNFIVL